MSPLSFHTYKNLPLPADAEAVAVGFARWREAAGDLANDPANDPANGLASDPVGKNLAAWMRDFAAEPSGKALLSSLFGNSPFLTQCSLKEPGLLQRLWRHGPEASFAELLASLNRDLKPGDGREELMARLRVLKRQAALTIGIADIAGLWPVDAVIANLSAFADGALALCVRHLLADAAAKGEIELPGAADPAHGSGFIVLGVGKLGSRELNYSSDVDLIILFDAETMRYRGKRDLQNFCTRLAQELVRMMEERTAEGYVFRTDLRLRPDPGSTPPALSRQAAIAYYESAGQNWERAALIRSRAVAGDLEAGNEFLVALGPFLWRKHLDFAAIQDIHSIKRQIHAHKGGATIAVAGHNIKLGRGGIREIEFFAQTQQLIWGGREPGLRVTATCAALAALARAGHITAEAAETLSRSYRFLRRIEHRLQMVEDTQTHTIPEDPAGLRRIAVFAGYANPADFAASLTRVLSDVESFYARLFEEAPSLASPGNLVFTGSEDDPETLKTLAGLGFAEPSSIAAIVRGWHHGRYRATRSQRARELLTELVPVLLKAFGASSNPDTALLRFDRYLGRLPAGVQLFSLLYQNPGMIDLIAEIMGAAPHLAQTLALHPGLIESGLTADFFQALPPRDALSSELRELLGRARHYEEILDFARRWVGERKFQIGVQLLRRHLDGEQAGGAFADIAETAIVELYERTAAEFARAHGAVKGGAFIVLGLGKLGSREMTFVSDLDLILVYDAPGSSESSGGPRPLPVTAYYARLCQRFINALTALTGEGNLYDVDMRLRPSGMAGPIASSLEAFRRYHQEAAWTWEHMALTRARAVAGPEPLRRRVMDEVREVLTRSRDPVRLTSEVADMRQRIAVAHRNPPEFEVKHRRGGMVDIEFIAQYLQLREAWRAPRLLHQNTRASLLALAENGDLAPEDAHTLVAALMLWRNVQGLLKLTVEEPFDESQASPALKSILAKGAGAVDFAALKADMDASAKRALRLYQILIEAPAKNAKRETEINP
jgi:glutamate-ammonia-ligase adenylyltransferase